MGWAHMAVPTSGAADLASYRLANRLVGNHPGVAALEIVGGLTVRMTARCYLAVTGPETKVELGQRRTSINSLVLAEPDQILTVGFPPTGIRHYLAIRGGVDVPATLGSCSHDVLSGLGPAPLQKGDLVAAGARTGPFPEIDSAPVRPAFTGAIEVLPGPQSHQLLQPLPATGFHVSPTSNRIAIRLDDGEVNLASPAEVPPQGLVRGAIQATPDGGLVVFGPDHPVTGGYPVIGVVSATHMDRLAQVRPGEHVVLQGPATRGG